MFQLKNREKETFLSLLFYPGLQWRMRLNLYWGGKSVLLILSNQMLISPRNTLTDTPRNVQQDIWALCAPNSHNKSPVISVPLAIRMKILILFLWRTLTETQGNVIIRFVFKNSQVQGTAEQGTRVEEIFRLAPSLAVTPWPSVSTSLSLAPSPVQQQ